MRARVAVRHDVLLEAGLPTCRRRGPGATGVAESMLRLQRDAGNRAVAGLVAQRETLPAKPPATAAPASGASTVPVIGPRPTAIAPGAPLPVADVGDKASPLGETAVVGSTTPSWNIVRTPSKKGFAGKVMPVERGEIRLVPRYPVPGLFTIGATKVVVGEEASARIRDGEQEHSNDYHLAFHRVYGVVIGAINRLAAQPAKCAPDQKELYRRWRQALAAVLPAPLRGPIDDDSPMNTWSTVLERLYKLTLERDTKGWHSMALGDGTPQQRNEHKVPKGVEFKRVIPHGTIGKYGSKERIDAAAPWLR